MNFRACFNACAAADALQRIKRQHLFPADSFGVMTPQTSQGTAFKEQGSPNPRPIMKAKMLYVEYPARPLRGFHKILAVFNSLSRLWIFCLFMRETQQTPSPNWV
jgi:hypothetical protein